MRMTYADLVRRAGALAAGLAARGIRPGMLVATALSTTTEHAISLLALARLGAVPALTNPRLKPEELALLISRGGIGFGRSTVQVFAQAGLLRRGTVLYHCVHTDEADLQALAASGAGLVHCPVSNLFGGDIAGTSRWMQYGLTAGIGTDFGRTDLWEAIRLAYLLIRGQSGPAASALDIFGWATAGGQHAYGYCDRGRVDPGAAADLVLLDMTRLRPMVDRPDLSTAAYAVLADTRPSCVRHVLIGGRPVLTDGQPVLVAADGLARRRRDLVHRLGG